jgi:predicted porin
VNGAKSLLHVPIRKLKKAPMKNTILAALTLVAAGSACAQSSVTIYGVVDVAASYYKGDGSGHVTRLTSGASQQSRLGFRGTEDLGSGAYAGFELEAGINPDSGSAQASNSNNQASGTGAASGLTFNRKSVAVLGGTWGEIRLGRDYTPSFWVLFAYDPFRTGVGFGVATTQGASPFTQLRVSNSVSYLTRKCYLYECTGFYGQVTYALGENAPGPNRKDGTAAGIRLGYGGGNWDLAFGRTETKDVAAGNYEQTMLGGSWDWGGGRLLLLAGRHHTGLPVALLQGGTSASFGQVGAFINVGNDYIPVAFTRVKRNDAQHGAADKFAVGYVHSLSKRTAIYGTFAFISNLGSLQLPVNVGADAGPTPVRGGKASGIDFGMRHSF